jgi:hypothetical protein
MSKNTIIILIILIILVGGIFLLNKDTPTPSNEVDTAIRTSVVDFGNKLKNVSLLMSAEDVRIQMQEHYGTYLTPELLAQWQKDPAQALGRSTSSPWPERIDIVSIISDSNDTYTVEGMIVEVTSADPPQQPAATYPVTLTVENRNGSWRIASMTRGAYNERPEEITVSGLWECLPHKDTSGPQTTECAFGIAKDQSDGHYALDFSRLGTSTEYDLRQHIRVEGALVPSNESNRHMWNVYPIDGIIAVTKIEKL